MDYIYQYDNIGDYYRDCLRPTQSNHLSSQTGRETFTYSPSLEATRERYSKGYPEGTKEAQKVMLQLTPYLRSVPGLKKGWKPQVYAGGNFILSNYVRGIPELCNVLSPVVSKKFCSIILNQSASCAISTEVMARRGTVVVALVNLLEQYGYRVAVKVAYALRGTSHFLYTIVTLKVFNQTLDGDRLAFFLGDPSSFRRLYFAYMESLPEPMPKDMLDRHYGVPIELPKDMIGEKDIYFPCASFNDSHWHSIEGTVTYLREVLKRYGIDMG